jgi:hypothetical protein
MDRHSSSFEGKIIDFYETFREAADKVAESGQYYMCNLLIDLDGDVAHTECQARRKYSMNDPTMATR